MERFHQTRHKRNWHRWVEGKLRDRARREDQFNGFEQSGGSDYFQPPATPDINQLMKSATEALGSSLRGVGLSDPWILDKSNTFEQAILNLGTILARTPLPSFLRETASSEMALLANSLFTLFTGGIKLHEAKQSAANTIFSGHFEHFDGWIKEVSVNQWLKRTHHPQFGRFIGPTCQIFVRGIRRQSRSRAIDSSDLRLRCGLRFGGWISDNQWRVSINSGIPAAEGQQQPLLKSIGPISQAYNESRNNPESFYYLQDTDTEDTFHFENPSTKTTKPGRSIFKFFTFNRYLNLVFRELARA